MKYCPACGEEYESGESCPQDGAVLMVKFEESQDPLLGTTLKDTFRVDSRIGFGGMGVVYRGTQFPLGRSVAIKTLRPDFAENPELVKRFFREAKLLSQFSHPNVVRLIDCGNTAEGLIFLVMEFLAGETLDDRIEAGTGLPFDRVLSICEQICAGLGEAHHQGLIHRDLKPSNVFLATGSGGEERVKLLDFGIAKQAEEEGTKLTKTGMVVGTPGYLSPEQITASSAVDLRSDIYSLGAILYFMIAGRAPYSGATPQSIIAKQITEPPEPIDFDRLKKPVGVREVIWKALAMKPEQRFQSTGELIAALRSIAAGGPAPRLPTPEPRPATTGSVQVSRTDSAGQIPTVKSERRRSGRRGLLSVLAVGLLLAAGAGGWFFTQEILPAGEEVPAPQPIAMGPGVTQDAITFGMSAAFSGSARQLGREMRVGIETSFAAVNEKGGVHGKKLRLRALDDGYEPDRTVSNMQTLLVGQPVFAIIGNVGTPTAEVAVPQAVAAKVPFIGAFTGADLLRKDPPDRYVFNYRASYAEETAAMVDYFLKVRKIKPGQIAVFAQQDGYGDAGLRGVEKSLRQHGYKKADSILRVGYRRNSIAVEEAVRTIIKHRKRVRAIVMVGTYRAAARFIEKIKQRKIKAIFANVSFVGSRALAEELLTLGEGLAEGVIVTQVVPHYDSGATGVIRYRELLARFFPEEKPGFVSLEGFIAGTIVAEALKKAGPEVKREALVDALESMNGLDLGIGVPIAFGPSNHQGSRKVWGTRLDAQGRYTVFEML